LRVISSSPTDVQPVFDTIACSAVRLCEAVNGAVFRFDGNLIHLAAYHNVGGDELAAVRRLFPIAPGHGSATGRAILSREVVHVEDMTKDPGYRATSLVQAGFRTVLSVPMLREGLPIGVINVTRMEAKPFSPDQIALLQTFADQAVIAIENVRLFKELETRNRDLTEALDRQTATSEILRVISSSPTNVQPVFDTIVRSAAGLCHAANAGVFLTDGRTLDLPANYGFSSPEALATICAQYPRPLDFETTAGVAILTRSVVHVPDIEEPSAAEVYTRRVGRLLGVRSMVAVPMMRKGEVVGAINLS
jgi:GAF domain-containing protein